MISFSSECFLSSFFVAEPVAGVEFVFIVCGNCIRYRMIACFS